ncbi:lipoprotein NlpI [Actinobacillus seminis]|uniref:Lipoprotein NlpI n=1 Tax=Actinobacillus seminis TaxID=722 RepID=A0A380VHC6_9PAST|nr:lipoprotein NlpI [Actinobacillus seminis]
MLQLPRLLKFVQFLPSFWIVLFLSGCISTGSSLGTRNKLILAEQNPNIHFEQEVMIVRISHRGADE